MKGNRLLFSLFKGFISIACIFLVGFFAYHYPDVMIYAMAVAIFVVFTWYFYTRDKET
jgi:hypothetical protein